MQDRAVASACLQLSRQKRLPCRYVDLFTHADGSGRQTWRLQSTPNGGVGLYASGREGACGLAYAAQGPVKAQLAPEASQWELVPGQCGGDILGEQNGCPCPRLGFK